MKLRNPFLINTIGLVGSSILNQLTATLDIRTDYGRWGRHPTDVRESRFIYVFWHENLLVPTVIRSRIAILISQHSDGELITQFVRHFRFGVVRGSSTRGGTAALRKLLEVSERSHLCITPDGPRGPRRQAQPGAVFVASQTGLPIVPIGAAYTNAWRMRSWDRFAIPKPFSGARGVVHEPIHVPRNLEAKHLGEYVRLLQERMDAATAEAEAWAAGTPRRTPAEWMVPFARSA